MTSPDLHGFLVVDKASGITSRHAVNVVQGWLPRGVKIGHAGTLDPLATGILVMALGQATRLVEYVQRMEKEYRAVITLGATSDTDDADGTVQPTPQVRPPSCAEIDRNIAACIGRIRQVPPAFSAAKVEGRRAHDLARRGKDVQLQAREVTVHEIRVIAYDFPSLEVVVRCGKGTYIRALARDLGQALGCGGYIHALRRTRIGPFAEGITLDLAPVEALSKLLPLEAGVCELLRLDLSESEIHPMECGSALSVTPDRLPATTTEIGIYDSRGRLRVVAQALDGQLRPVKVLRVAQG